MRKLILCLSFILTFLPQTYANFENGMPADIVVGQTDFVSSSSGAGKHKLNQPIGLHVDGGKLFVTDLVNDRVLIWNKIPKTHNAPADVVVGQPDFETTTGGVTQNTMNGPIDVITHGNRLFVSSSANHRILIFNQIPTQNGASADIVLGQSDFTSNGNALTQTGLRTPQQMAIANGKLMIADTNNDRILIWNNLPTSIGQPADVVVGQPDFTTAIDGIGREGMRRPFGVASDGKAFVVLDRSNFRILIWNEIPTQNYTPADIVLGQPDFQSSTGGSTRNKFSVLHHVAIHNGQLFVTDANGNRRLLIWKRIPKENNIPPDIVIGKPNFSDIATGTSRTRTSILYDIVVTGKQLFLADGFNNNRVLIFNIAGDALDDLGPQFTQGKAVVGKVFWDFDGNGRQG